MKQTLKVALLCGGPSIERGISLNSARSVCDHLQGDGIQIIPIYFDHYNRAFQISIAQLYSNTPSDFDFKLHSSAKILSKITLKELLRSTHIAFPVMHGKFGEDGTIQTLLERYKVPYIGSSSQACIKCFDKANANRFLRQHGFYAIPSLLLELHSHDHRVRLEKFFKTHNLDRVIVKPALGGSSIGVSSVSTPTQALEKANDIFNNKIDNRVVIEKFCIGKEFTVIILQNRFDLPVAILPTEIEVDYSHHQIFDYRKKYLATNQVRYFCPPMFDDRTIEKIQIQAEQLFQLFGMKDFARFDGWVLSDGKILFSDFNPVSGMEQNSFLFQQCSRIGMSHRDALRFIVKNACRRHDIEFPSFDEETKTKRKPVNVLFGGSTSERQVSLMSGTNVWLKLRRSKKYDPKPFLLDTNHNVWHLPYAYTLNHTVEEIQDACEQSVKSEERLQPLKTRVLEKLDFTPNLADEAPSLPGKMSLDDFLNESEIVFNALHGGIGEDGTIQSLLDKKGKYYTGSRSVTSQICMDKYKTSEVLTGLEKRGINTAPKIVMLLTEFNTYSGNDYKLTWKCLCQKLKAKTIIVKPKSDGCSTGIVRLYNKNDLIHYVNAVVEKQKFIPLGTFTNQHGIIEMPTTQMTDLLFEPFIETDDVSVVKNKLKWVHKTGWIEITMGVFGNGKNIKAFNPSLTISTGNIVTLEEKFQGGTGINITPPPQPFVSKKAIYASKHRMGLVAKTLGISGYARIDAFMETKSGMLIIIEANTSPGLTPSTVIYHQALAENHPLYPTDFLEKIVHLALHNKTKNLKNKNHA